MLYLLDASVLITANSSYYAVDRVPEYWSWLRHVGELGRVKLPREIFEEIRDGPRDRERDLLFDWLQDDRNRGALLLEEEVDPRLVQRVVADGYAADLTDEEIEKLGRDPFLIAYALVGPSDRCVITVEVSKPSRIRANRRIPDVCRSLGVDSRDPFFMGRALGFRTNWNE